MAATQSGRPALKRLYPDTTTERDNPHSLSYWSSKSTQEIIDSLASDRREPLTVKSDGTVIQGNTRILILQRRGLDVNELPRVPYP
jgi:hypothetical protein